MHNPVQVTSDMYWVGASDRRLALFENVFPIPKGVSYNSYLVLDEKTVLLDTTDRAVSGQMLENIAYLLNGRALDYLIVNHMEPDHAASMGELVLRYPAMQIVCNAKALAMIRNYFDFDIDSRVMVVKEGDTLQTGRHSFSFVMAPMVHWPEVMVTYDAADRVLYCADAFGTFGALNGNIFADEVDFEGEWLPEARRYYTNIVGKYGNQVQALLKKASALQIDLLCPLHGPIWRSNIAWFVEKYSRWSAYVPEGGIDRLCFRIWRDGKRRQHPGFETGREGAPEYRHVRCFQHASVYYRIRSLPLQPFGLCIHHLQCRYFLQYGNGLIGY